MNIITEMQMDFKKWFHNFWYVLRKNNSDCNLDELVKKHSFHKRMGFSWLFTNLITLSIMVEMFSNGKASLTIMVLFLATLLCLYDEMQTKGMVEMFIFWKKQKILFIDEGYQD